MENLLPFAVLVMGAIGVIAVAFLFRLKRNEARERVKDKYRRHRRRLQPASSLTQ